MKHTIKCPVCGQGFYPDADHRFGGNCSAICARAATQPGRFTFHTPSLDMSVIAKPAVVRKPSKQNWGKTE